jgi:single-strand DNA-binding protein
MKNLNQIRLRGNIGNIQFSKKVNKEDASKEVSILTVSVATNESYKQNDEWITKTTWHSVICFNALAESKYKELAVGDTIDVLGSLSGSTYFSQEGKKIYSYKTIASDIEKY